MEKRNTLLLTVIAIATLLVAVVGATFAYFATNTDTNNVINVTATTGGSGSTFIVEPGWEQASTDTTNRTRGDGIVTIDYSGDKANEDKKGETYTDTDQLAIKLMSGDDTKEAQCAYNVAIEELGDHYLPSRLGTVTEPGATSTTTYVEGTTQSGQTEVKELTLKMSITQLDSTADKEATLADFDVDSTQTTLFSETQLHQIFTDSAVTKKTLTLDPSTYVVSTATSGSKAELKISTADKENGKILIDVPAGNHVTWQIITVGIAAYNTAWDQSIALPTPAGTDADTTAVFTSKTFKYTISVSDVTCNYVA